MLSFVVPVQSNAGPVNGAVVEAWAASRFTNTDLPAENSPPPSGTPDAATVTSTLGGPGQALLTVASPGLYNIRVVSGGVVYWSQENVYPSPTDLVTSFNTRVGAVVLTKADVTGTGLTYSDVGADPTGAALAAQNAAETYADQYAGSTAGTAGKPLAATDPTTTDSRTPTSHASTHAAAGTDSVIITEAQVTNLTTDLAAKASTAYVDTQDNLAAKKASNLSDLASAPTARTNLGVDYPTLDGRYVFAPAPSGDTSGVTDTVALQTFIDAHAGQTIYFSGNSSSTPYYLNAPLYRPPLTTFIGCGRYGSNFKAAAGTNLVAVVADKEWANNVLTQQYGGGVINMGIDGNKAGQQPSRSSVSVTVSGSTLTATAGTFAASDNNAKIVQGSNTTYITSVNVGANTATVLDSTGFTTGAVTITKQCGTYDPTANPNGGHGIVLMAGRLLVDGNYVKNCPVDGILLSNVPIQGYGAIYASNIENQFTRNWVEFCGRDGFHVLAGGAGTTNACTDGILSHNTIYSNGRWNINLEVSAGWWVESNHSYGGWAIGGVGGYNIASLFGAYVTNNEVDHFGGGNFGPQACARLVTGCSWASNTTTISGPAGSFLQSDVGSWIPYNSNGIWQSSNTYTVIQSVNGDGSQVVVNQHPSGASTTINGSGMSDASTTLTVTSSTSFPSSGQVSVPGSGGTLVFAYTAKTSTTLTGCTLVSGSAGTISSGATVSQAYSGNLMLRNPNTHTLSGVTYTSSAGLVTMTAPLGVFSSYDIGATVSGSGITANTAITTATADATHSYATFYGSVSSPTSSPVITPNYIGMNYPNAAVSSIGSGITGNMVWHDEQSTLASQTYYSASFIGTASTTGLFTFANNRAVNVGVTGAASSFAYKFAAATGSTTNIRGLNNTARNINTAPAVVSGPLTFLDETPGGSGGLSGTYLPIAGGTMTGALAMGTNKITGLVGGSAATDAVNFSQLSALYTPSNPIERTGSRAISATWSMPSSGSAPIPLTQAPTVGNVLVVQIAANYLASPATGITLSFTGGSGAWNHQSPSSSANRIEVFTHTVTSADLSGGDPTHIQVTYTQSANNGNCRYVVTEWSNVDTSNGVDGVDSYALTQTTGVPQAMPYTSPSVALTGGSPNDAVLVMGQAYRANTTLSVNAGGIAAGLWNNAAPDLHIDDATGFGIALWKAFSITASISSSLTFSLGTTTINGTGMSSTSTTLTFASTAIFSNSGQVSIPGSSGTLVFAFTGKAGNTLTGCTLVSGLAGTIADGAVATPLQYFFFSVLSLKGSPTIQDNTKLPLSGGTMTGNIVMSGTSTITGLPAATANGQAVRFEQLPSLAAADASVVVGGTAVAPTVRTATLDVIATQHPPTNPVPMNGQKLTGLPAGTTAGDSVRFEQLPATSPTPPLNVQNAIATLTNFNPGTPVTFNLGSTGTIHTGSVPSPGDLIILTIGSSGNTAATSGATFSPTSSGTNAWNVVHAETYGAGTAFSHVVTAGDIVGGVMPIVVDGSGVTTFANVQAIVSEWSNVDTSAGTNGVFYQGVVANGSAVSTISNTSIRLAAAATDGVVVMGKQTAAAGAGAATVEATANSGGAQLIAVKTAPNTSVTAGLGAAIWAFTNAPSSWTALATLQWNDWTNTGYSTPQSVFPTYAVLSIRGVSALNDPLKLPLSGGTMSGAIAMGGSKITGLSTSPSTSGDAIAYGASAGGDLTGTYPNPTLGAVGSASGPIGSASVTPVVTTDSKGRVTALTSATITPAAIGALGSTAAAGGDLTGNYPNPTLKNTGTPQTATGSGTAVPVLTTDAQGRVTAVATAATVGSVAAADTSIVIAGTATAPTVKTGTLDVVATQHPPVASVPMNSQKLTGLAAGTTAGDSVRFEQLTPANTGVTQFKILSCVLTVASGTSAGTTTLTVAATPQAMKSGSTLQLVNYTAIGGAATTQTVTLNGDHAAGLTTLTVNSFTPSMNFPIGTEVAPFSVTCDLAALGLSKATLIQFEAVSGGTGGGGAGSTSTAATAQTGGGGGAGGSWINQVVAVGVATQITGIKIGIGSFGGTGGAAAGATGVIAQAGVATTATLNGTTVTTPISGPGAPSAANSTTAGDGGIPGANRNSANSSNVPGGGGIGSAVTTGVAGTGFGGSGGGGGGVSSTTNGGGGGGAGGSIGGAGGATGGGSTSPSTGAAGAAAAINSAGGGGGGGAGGGQTSNNGAGGAGGAGGSGYLIIKVVG